jgi:hypothetical protein
MKYIFGKISPIKTKVFLPNANIKCLSVFPNKLLSKREKNCQKDKDTFFRKEKMHYTMSIENEIDKSLQQLVCFSFIMLFGERGLCSIQFLTF